jgi:hypothetical protein
MWWFLRKKKPVCEKFVYSRISDGGADEGQDDYCHLVSNIQFVSNKKVGTCLAYVLAGEGRAEDLWGYVGFLVATTDDPGDMFRQMRVVKMKNGKGLVISQVTDKLHLLDGFNGFCCPKWYHRMRVELGAAILEEGDSNKQNKRQVRCSSRRQKENDHADRQYIVRDIQLVPDNDSGIYSVRIFAEKGRAMDLLEYVHSLVMTTDDPEDMFRTMQVVEMNSGLG